MSNPRLGSWFIVIRNNTNNAILCIDTFSFHSSTSLSKNHLHNEYYLVILYNFKIMTIIHSEPSGIHSISIEMNLDSKTAVKITKIKIMIKVIYTHTAHADCMLV